MRTVLLTTSTFPKSENDAKTAPFVLDLARSLSRHFRIVVLAPGAKGLPRESRREGIDIVRYTYFLPRSRQLLTGGEGALANLRDHRLARLQAPPLVLAQMAALPAVIRRYGVDLVNSHWLVPQGFAYAVVRAFAPRPHVVTCHAAGVFLLRRIGPGRALARYIRSRTDLFLPVSGHLSRCLEELAGGPVPHRVIPMGVDTARFSPGLEGAEVRRSAGQKGERLILFVGKLVPKKGVFVLLEAFRDLVAIGPPARLALIGGGPLEARIRARIRELGIGDRVEMTGWIRNRELPPWFAAADVVCVPSITDERGETEGMPVVVQEALGAGRVLVAADVGGIRDVVRDGESGYLAPAGDPAALATVLARALALPAARRTAMASAARSAALRNAWPRVADRYAEAFESVLRRRR